VGEPGGRSRDDASDVGGYALNRMTATSWSAGRDRI
jgi:hypothetical protein